MRLRASKTSAWQVAAFAAFALGCSKSASEPVGTSDAAAPHVATATAKPPPAGPPALAPTVNEPAVLEVDVKSPDGKTCKATVDGDCQQCLQKAGGKEVIAGCEALTGNAKSGPAPGTPRSRLCRELLDCVRRTSCHVNDLTDCYCGKITLGECISKTDTKGPCKKEMDRALEVHPGTVGNSTLERITEPTIAGGVAGLIATTENTGCPKECIPYKATDCP